MTAQILTAELTNLVADSKRRNAELRNAAEKSLQDLKSISVTSEAQLAADLVRRPNFISPFLIACSSKNSKSVSSGAGCIQRLAISRALPKERLKDVIEAVRESSSFGLDVQLKVLQTLSALTQNYSSIIRGELLFGLLQVCSTLQASKQASVSNSAAATLQQLIAALFERLDAEDSKAHDVPAVATVASSGGDVQVRPVAHDAFRVFHDLCLITEGQKPHYLIAVSLPQASGLELIESILSSHALVFDEHPEQATVLRTVLMPFIIRSLSERQSFAITVRILRVLSAVVRLHLSLAPSECEIALSLLNHMLDPDAATPWKRALCMEVFRGIYSDMSVLLQLCSTYDQQEGKKQVLRDNLAMFVRLASEKPAAIGLGQQSTAPAGLPMDEGTSDTATIETTGVAGLISGSTGVSGGVGISAHFSTVKTSFLDQLDKTDAPPVPDTYIYALVLVCISSLSDCLARFILPLTVHREARGRKRADTQDTVDQGTSTIPSNDGDDTASLHTDTTVATSDSQKRRNVPVNPLTLEGHKSFKGITSVAALIEGSWPAVLATCSTFLYASLDNDYYRSLVRSVQKFTQVAGLLRMTTPRDALLTTLCKAAVPTNVIAASASPSISVPESPGKFKASFLSVDSLVSPGASSDSARRHSADNEVTDLNARNLLCLRALLNIAIALGPTLLEAWGIVCESLQQAEMIMSTSIARGSRQSRSTMKSPQRPENDADTSQSVATEVNAVQAAATRMFESSAEFPDEAFVYLLTALCRLLDEDEPQQPGESKPAPSPTRRQHQRRVGSYSSISVNIDSQTRDSVLVLRKIADVANLNIERFVHIEPHASGWTLLTKTLISVACNSSAANAARKLSAEILCHLVQDTIKASAVDDADHQSAVQQRCFDTFVLAIRALEEPSERPHAQSFDSEIHYIWLEALRLIIEASGDALVTGWTQTFSIVLTAFLPHDLPLVHSNAELRKKATKLEEPSIAFTHAKIGRAAFDVVQLICSDFLRMVSEDKLATLVDILFCFCVQQDDLNIALTTTGLFWIISDFLQTRLPMTELSLRLEELNATEQSSTPRPTESATDYHASWLRLLQRLVTVTADTRPEVRDTAVHTLFRILGNSELSGRAWTVCFEGILFRMLDYNILRHEAIAVSETKARESWVNTSGLMLDDSRELFAANLEVLNKAAQWSLLFNGFVERFRGYLDLQLRTTHAVVYANLAAILSQISDNSADLVNEGLVGDLWLKYPPAETSADGEANTARSYEAYVKCFRELYRLFHTHLQHIPTPHEHSTVAVEASDVADVPEETENPFKQLLQHSPFALDLPPESYRQPHQSLLDRSVASLFNCVRTSTQATYGNDIETMTDLQRGVLDCLQDIYKTDRKAISLIVMTLGQSIAIPFAASNKNRSSAAPTFIALAKAAMGALSTLAQDDHHNKADLTSSSLVFALASLAQPIQLKYQWTMQGKAPFLWQQATTTVLAVLRSYLRQATQGSPRGTARNTDQIWLLTVVVAQAIARATHEDLENLPTVYDDEQFDIKALTELRDLLVPALGSSTVSDAIRRSYTSTLFSTSLIHQTEPGEFPEPPAEPLEGLYSVRLGRTISPAPVVRLDMAYHCFSELLELTSFSGTGQEDPERIALARAAAPYLILRAALPLKAYSADQHLRGRMPQPYTEREELLFVLRQMTALKTVSKAIPAAAGAASEEKRHLFRLYPLVTKALHVAGRARGLAKDDELIGGLTKWLDAVGDEFGI